MRVGVVGSGAVGLYYGARLQRSGEEVHFLVRSDLEEIRRTGIRIRASDSTFQLSQVNAYESVESIGVVDLVLIAVKTTSNALLPDLLKPIVGPDTVLLTLQNGLGNVAFLRDFFPKNPILSGSCFVGLNRVGPGTVENYYLGSIAIAGERANEVALCRTVSDWFRKASLNANVFENMEQLHWKKLLWNIPFNGLSIVAGRVATDVILNDRNLSRLARGIMEEIVSIAGALGHEIESELIDQQFEITKTMGEYKPSSLLDFAAGKKVEVEAIWGEPLREAIRAGVDAPKLETLYRLLRISCADRG